MKANSLQDRLIQFAANCVKFQKHLLSGDASVYYSKQLIRSSGSAALNYGEAQGSESKKDFVHKLGIALKESRESLNNLKIIQLSGICVDHELTKALLNESNELVAMLVTAVRKSKNQT